MDNSSKMLLGEFLIERGWLSKEQLSSAWTRHIVQSPLPSRIALDLELLTPEELLRVLGTQARNQIDFMQACREEGLWTTDFEARIQIELDTERFRLAGILIEMRLISRNDLDRALAEYAQHYLDGPRVSSANS